jgi:hypothetical protein
MWPHTFSTASVDLPPAYINRPISAEKIFLFESLTPTFYGWSVDSFRVSLPVFEFHVNSIRYRYLQGFQANYTGGGGGRGIGATTMHVAWRGRALSNFHLGTAKDVQLAVWHICRNVINNKFGLPTFKSWLHCWVRGNNMAFP